MTQIAVDFLTVGHAIVKMTWPFLLTFGIVSSAVLLRDRLTR